MAVAAVAFFLPLLARAAAFPQASLSLQCGTTCDGAPQSAVRFYRPGASCAGMFLVERGGEHDRPNMEHVPIPVSTIVTLPKDAAAADIDILFAGQQHRQTDVRDWTCTPFASHGGQPLRLCFLVNVTEPSNGIIANGVLHSRVEYVGLETGGHGEVVVWEGALIPLSLDCRVSGELFALALVVLVSYSMPWFTWNLCRTPQSGPPRGCFGYSQCKAAVVNVQPCLPTWTLWHTAAVVECTAATVYAFARWGQSLWYSKQVVADMGWILAAAVEFMASLLWARATLGDVEPGSSASRVDLAAHISNAVGCFGFLASSLMYLWGDVTTVSDLTTWWELTMCVVFLFNAVLLAVQWRRDYEGHWKQAIRDPWFVCMVLWVAAALCYVVGMSFGAHDNYVGFVPTSNARVVHRWNRQILPTPPSSVTTYAFVSTVMYKIADTAYFLAAWITLYATFEFEFDFKLPWLCVKSKDRPKHQGMDDLQDSLLTANDEGALELSFVADDPEEGL